MTISDTHLTPEELIDAAEGTRAEAALAHLAVCDACRRQLTELQTSMTWLHDAEVPEPSPLYWTQFSRRVADGVAADASTPRGWFASLRPRLIVPLVAAACAAAFLAIALTRSSTPAAPASTQASTTATAPTDVAVAEASDADADSDRSLELVADLTAGIDLSDAIDAGLASPESAEHAVTHMSADELATLQRLLTEAMARRGA